MQFRILTLLLLAAFVPSESAASLESDERVEVVTSGLNTLRVIHLSPEPFAISKIVVPDGPDWVRDMRVDVTNTSGKPIYMLHFVVVLPEMGPRKVSQHMSFGRLPTIESVAPSDAPRIAPGETLTMKVDQERYKGFLIASKEAGWPEPHLAELRFQFASHGDGTGWMLNRRVGK